MAFTKRNPVNRRARPPSLLPTGVGNALPFFNGTFREPFDALVTESGGTITMSLTRQGAGDLMMRFSDGLTELDVTPAKTITLTAGSDTAPQGNWIYIPQSTKVLTKSTTAWPTTEHIKVGYFLVPSATFVGTDGVYVNQNWNDFGEDTVGQGHLTHITERMRVQGAAYFSGLGGAGTDDYLTLAGTTSDLKINAGVVFQLHRHNFDAFDTSTGDVVLVVNWSGDAYHNITNLFDIVADSTGTTITNNRYFNIVGWVVGNKTGEYHPAMINLPSGFYNTQADAENDVDGHDNFTMPRAFINDSGTGALVFRSTIQMKTAGPWVYKSSVDLRGTNPQTAAGVAGATVTEFTDNQFNLFNVTDITKIVDFDLSGLTTATTRTYTAPDTTGTLLLEETVGLWGTWAPTYTNLTVGNGTVVARFTQIGKTITGYWELTFGSTTTIDGTNPIVSIPVTAASDITFSRNVIGGSYIFDSGTNAWDGSVRLQSATEMSVGLHLATGTYASFVNITATVPHTWATGDVLSMAFTYEVA